MFGIFEAAAIAAACGVSSEVKRRDYYKQRGLPVPPPPAPRPAYKPVQDSSPDPLLAMAAVGIGASIFGGSSSNGVDVCAAPAWSGDGGMSGGAGASGDW